MEQAASRKVDPSVASTHQQEFEVSPTQRKAFVLGAGIIGLTSAIRLREAGYDVHISAKETPTSIFARDSTPLKGKKAGVYTSSGSGGYWMPFHSHGAKMEEWCTMTYRVFEKEATEGVSSVRMHDGFILRATSFPDPLPWYADLTGMTKIRPEEDVRIPDEYYGALKMCVPIVVMDTYLPQLERRARQLGITFEFTSIVNITQACEMAMKRFNDVRNTVVVNCTGVCAHTVSNDTEVIPGRGVTVRVRRPVGMNYFITEDDEDGILSRDGKLAYCLPRGEEYTLGGTIFEGQWSTDTGEQEMRDVVYRSSALIPSIEKAEVTGVWTGLRPMRKCGIRLEVERRPQKHGIGIAVVANYGHGGGGVTCCWGTADEVVMITEGLFSE